MKAMIQKFIREEDGASAVEYGLLVALVALAIIAGATALGTNVNKLFKDSADKVVAPASS